MQEMQNALEWNETPAHKAGSSRFKKNQIKEVIAKGIFTIAAAISILSVFLICWFLFANGIPAIKEIGVTNFLFGIHIKVQSHEWEWAETRMRGPARENLRSSPYGR